MPYQATSNSNSSSRRLNASGLQENQNSCVHTYRSKHKDNTTFKKFYYIYSFSVYTGSYVVGCTCGGQRITFRSQFSQSTTWALANKLGLSDLAVSEYLYPPTGSPHRPTICILNKQSVIPKWEI